jgi:hypothetical protein
MLNKDPFSKDPHCSYQKFSKLAFLCVQYMCVCVCVCKWGGDFHAWQNTGRLLANL